jgi:hypothetical protein
MFSLWQVKYRHDREFSDTVIMCQYSDHGISQILSIIMKSIHNALYILMKILGQMEKGIAPILTHTPILSTPAKSFGYLAGLRTGIQTHEQDPDHRGSNHECKE